MSGGYPLGVVASSSGTQWDARIGTTDQSPTRRRTCCRGWCRRPRRSSSPAAATPRSPRWRRASLAAGNGPRAGGGSAGPRRRRHHVRGRGPIRLHACLGRVDTRRVSNTTTPAVARGLSIDAMQTLTGRWFLAGPINRVSAPVFATPARSAATNCRFREATAGIACSQDFTLLAAYQNTRWYGAPRATHGIATSVVWARRWR